MQRDKVIKTNENVRAQEFFTAAWNAPSDLGVYFLRKIVFVPSSRDSANKPVEPVRRRRRIIIIIIHFDRSDKDKGVGVLPIQPVPKVRVRNIKSSEFFFIFIKASRKKLLS